MRNRGTHDRRGPFEETEDTSVIISSNDTVSVFQMDYNYPRVIFMRAGRKRRARERERDRLAEERKSDDDEAGSQKEPVVTSTGLGSGNRW